MGQTAGQRKGTQGRAACHEQAGKAAFATPIVLQLVPSSSQASVKPSPCTMIV